MLVSSHKFDEFQNEKQNFCQLKSICGCGCSSDPILSESLCAVTFVTGSVRFSGSCVPGAGLGALAGILRLEGSPGAGLSACVFAKDSFAPAADVSSLCFIPGPPAPRPHLPVSSAVEPVSNKTFYFHQVVGGSDLLAWPITHAFHTLFDLYRLQSKTMSETQKSLKVIKVKTPIQ